MSVLDPFILVRPEGRLKMIANVQLEPKLHTQGISKQVSHYSHPLSNYPPGLGGILTGDFKNREPKEGPFDVVDPSFSDGHLGRTALFHSIFPQVDAPRQDVSVDKFMRTLSRIDRAFINVSNVGSSRLSISGTSRRRCWRPLSSWRPSSDPHPEQKATLRNPDSAPIRAWITKHPRFCSMPVQFHEAHVEPDDPFFALGDFQDTVENATVLAHSALQRVAWTAHGVELFIASTAGPTCRNRHLKTPTRCCEVKEPGAVWVVLQQRHVCLQQPPPRWHKRRCHGHLLWTRGQPRNPNSLSMRRRSDTLEDAYEASGRLCRHWAGAGIGPAFSGNVTSTLRIDNLFTSINMSNMFPTTFDG